MKIIDKRYLKNKYINNAILNTVKKIKKDKNPNDINKITLNAYLRLLKK